MLLYIVTIITGVIICIHESNKYEPPSGYYNKETWSDKNIKGYEERTDIPFTHNEYGYCRTYRQ